MSPLRFLGSLVVGTLSSSSRRRIVGSARFLHQSRNLADGVEGFGFSNRFPMGGNLYGSAMAVCALSALAGGSLYFIKDAEEESAPVAGLKLTAEERAIKVAVVLTDDENAMRRRFEEWKIKYKRKYKDKQDEAFRYELFKIRALRADEMNELYRDEDIKFGEGVFSDLTQRELPCFGHVAADSWDE